LTSDTTSYTPSSHSAVQRIDIVYGISNIGKSYSQLFLNAKRKVDNCINCYNLLSYYEFELIKKSIIEAKTRGVISRYLIDITKDNIKYCKELSKIVDELRHLDGVKNNFVLSESEYIAIPVQEKSQPVTQIIYSNINPIVQQMQCVFNTFWYKSIPAEQKIIELEEGIELEGIKIIRNPVEVQNLTFDLLKSVKDEILIIFSTANAFHRQEKAGSIKLLTEIASKKGDVNIKIMTPIDNKLQDIKRNLENVKIKEKTEHKKEKNGEISRKKNYKLQKSNKIEIRFIERQQQTTISILIVDRKYSLAVELKDDTKDTTYEAIGLATYSNSKSTVLSYASIFETLWLQTELYDRLKVQDKIQKDFINIAAHELRTPIQPIIAITEIVYSQSKEDKEKRKLLEVIMRNAKRLKRLTDDILDVAKIESQSLQTQKEWFNIENVISGLVSQYKTNIKEMGKTLNLNFIMEEKNLFIKADKGRITQVVDNLLCNAIKFTEGKLCGSITITAKREEDIERIKVIIKDTGTGINTEILSRLFTKFATKSDSGTGLGLYISKKIIEAHGGKIWGKNNNNNDGNRIGAEFGFTLPIE